MPPVVPMSQRGRDQHDGSVGTLSAAYTGVGEQGVGRKPGIVKQTVMLEYGVYETRQVKLNVEYCGFDGNRPMSERLKLSITLPSKWLEAPTPVSALKAAFARAYRRKFPTARLSCAAEAEWGLAVKDESMLVFSKRPVADDDIITNVFYDRQDIWAMADWDWAEMRAEIARLRKVIVDDVAHTMRNVRHDPERIVPVTSNKQIVPSQSYVLLTGWFKQQCCIVQPEFTVADIKAYLHHKNGARMPIESLDIAMRRGDTVEVLDAALTLQQVYEMQVANDAKAENAASSNEEVESEIAAEIDGDHEAEMTSAAASPSFVGKAMALGVGKRIQDRKHQIWLPQVHDPYSFRTPHDQAPDGGARHEAIAAPRGWSAAAATQPTVNADEQCALM